MKIAVLVKAVPNPAGRPELSQDLRLRRDGREGVLDPGDEHAVEAAVRIAEAHAGEITALSMGPASAVAAVRRAIAMGAHHGILVTDPVLAGADALVTARVLAAALRCEGYDLVIAGVESTDGSTGTLPITIAQLLDLPSVTFARRIELSADTIRVERQTPRGYNILECSLPCVLTVTAAANEPRYPSFKGVVRAKQARVSSLSLADLPLTPSEVVPAQKVIAAAELERRSAGEILENASVAPARIVAMLEKAGVL
ncbi:electron transfer flavoprotein subunit beta/FixA family protein [Bradyrhizobium sp. 169]|uniref:electron transfer flavoprotein subunit beta/FixA family protein n=1 Tax=Bradyrhizobium sp. 169 TaxID=2782640 RepID=UPI001FF9C640|nr:electron transfer flavoprotein subunit beta/FixA family protein [Bradyrhizobium sp. 169]MCK1589099.1 electron transfer flavoprotein subunit beta/FixA family protein [Bradyrhizobium sp. 169]